MMSQLGYELHDCEWIDDDIRGIDLWANAPKLLASWNTKHKVPIWWTNERNEFDGWSILKSDQ